MIDQTTATALNRQVGPPRNSSENKMTEHNRKPDATNSPNGSSRNAEMGQSLLNNKLVDEIDKVLQKNNAGSIRTLDAQDYTPKAVSDRILGFVQDAIDLAESRGGNGAALLAQARQGVKKGFQDAENILTSLNALSGKIAENVESTFSLIQTGLDKIGNALSATNTSVQQSASFQSYQQSSSQRLSLDITTRDGDLLTLSLEKNQSTGSIQAQILKDNTSVTISESTIENSSSFSFALSGVLDEGEITAIKRLLNDVKGISNQFFDGDSAAALKAGLSLGFDTQELTSFSLNLNQNQSQSATLAYQEINTFSENVDYSRPPTELSQLLGPIQDFTKSLESILFNATDSTPFKNDATENLFSFFANAEDKNQAMIEQLEKLSGKSFRDITSDILSRIEY